MPVCRDCALKWAIGTSLILWCHMAHLFPPIDCIYKGGEHASASSHCSEGKHNYLRETNAAILHSGYQLELELVIRWWSRGGDVSPIHAPTGSQSQLSTTMFQQVYFYVTKLKLTKTKRTIFSNLYLCLHAGEGQWPEASYFLSARSVLVNTIAQEWTLSCTVLPVK